jgi:hypothetical protein
MSQLGQSHRIDWVATPRRCPLHRQQRPNLSSVANGRVVPNSDIGQRHSITSSASVSRLSEILSPSVFAVFKLITSSNLVG